MALLAHTESASKTDGGGGLFLSSKATPKSLASIIKDGARLMVTPALAERIISECFYAPQEARDVGGSRHIAILAADMTAGRFTDGTQIHFGAVGDKIYLLDGNHRIRAVIASGKTVEFSILRDEVASFAALGPLYWRHDFVTRSRSMVLAAVVSGRGADLGKQRMAAVMSAMPMLAGNFAKGPGAAQLSMRSPDIRLAAYRSWVKYGEAYFAAVTGCSGSFVKRFNRTGVLAVGMATFKHQPEKAEEFWRTLAADDGLRQGDPRKTLLKYLVETSLAAKEGQTASATATALCWNAFFEGRQLSVLKLSAQHFYIAGTPYARKFIKHEKA